MEDPQRPPSHLRQERIVISRSDQSHQQAPQRRSVQSVTSVKISLPFTAPSRAPFAIHNDKTIGSWKEVKKPLTSLTTLTGPDSGPRCPNKVLAAAASIPITHCTPFNQHTLILCR